MNRGDGRRRPASGPLFITLTAIIRTLKAIIRTLTAIIRTLACRATARQRRAALPSRNAAAIVQHTDNAAQPRHFPYALTLSSRMGACDRRCTPFYCGSTCMARAHGWDIA